MSLTNQALAAALEQFADDLESVDANPYRIRAYRRAAASIRRSKRELVDFFQQDDDLTVIPYVGKSIAATLIRMLTTSNLQLTVNTKTIKPLSKGLDTALRKEKFFKLYLLIPIIEKILKQLQEWPQIKKLEVAGDYRRKKEIVGDIIILMQANAVEEVFKKFQRLPVVHSIIDENENTLTVQLQIGSYLRLKNIEKNKFGEKLLQYTGVDEHYHSIKKILDEKKISSSGENEIHIYEKINLPFIPPELRENRGEIEMAAQGKLPILVELSDIKGDLHCHTHETDGFYSLEEMVEAAMSRGYHYLAITDHSQSLKITNGMNEKRLLKQIEQINKLNSTLKNFVILKSMEVDILEDGTLDMPNAVLKELDLTVCSIHSKFKLDSHSQTNRLLRAMDNPYFTILGHATGRLIKHRPPYPFDIERVLLNAKERNCFLEVNAQPARLDINDLYCKRAKEIGVKVAISSDAHTIQGLDYMVLGVNQARRGWLEAKDVINTYDLLQFKKIIKRS